MRKISPLTLIFLLIVIFCFVGCNEVEDLDLQSEKYIYLPKTENVSIDRTSGSSDDFKIEFEYDSHGNVVKEEKLVGSIFSSYGHSLNTEFTYNELFQPVKEVVIEEYSSFADGETKSGHGYEYIYNEKNQLVKIVIINIYGQSIFKEFLYEYDDNENCIKEIVVYANDKTENEITRTYEYDSNNKLVKLIGVDYEINYTYDSDGRLISSKRTDYEPNYSSNPGAVSGYSINDYQYDSKNRLIKMSIKYFNSDDSVQMEKVSEYSDFVKVSVDEYSVIPDYYNYLKS